MLKAPRVKLEYIFMLLAIAFAAISLADKIFYINTEFNYEELFTAVTAWHELPFSFIFKNFLIVDVHPPLYNFLMYALHYFVPVVTEVSLRLPGILFYASALAYCFFWFPKKYSKLTKYIFICFIATSAPLSFYGWEARAYTLMFFLSVPFTFLAISMADKLAARKETSKKEYFWYFLLSLLLCYTHYFAALFAGAVWVILFGFALKYKAKLKPFIFIPLSAAALLSIWMLPNLYFNWMQERFDGNWWNLGKAHILFFLQDCITFAFTKIGRYLIAAMGAVCIFYIYKAEEFKAKIEEYHAEIILFSAATLIMFGVAGIVLLKINLLVERYFICLLPPLFLLLSVVFSLLFERAKWPALLLAAFLFLNITHSGYTKILHDTKPVAQRILDLKLKEIKVASLEYYPRPSIPYMYGFYLNYRMKANVKVVDYFYNPTLPLAKEELVWMPNCKSFFKVDVLAEQTGKIFSVREGIYDSCLLVENEEERKYQESMRAAIGNVDKMKSYHNPSGKLDWLK